MPITIWLNAANVLYLVSYSVRDILWLRILTVVAALLLIPYYALQPVPLMAAIAWNGVFIAINLYWIVVLMIERRPVHFTPDEERLKVLAFPTLTQQDARSLFSRGMWVDLSPGNSLVQHDLEANRASVILRGIASVMHSGVTIAELGEGQFVGTIDDKAETLDLDAVVKEEVRVLCWSRSNLEKFMNERPDVAVVLERSVGLEVSRILGTALSDIRQGQ